MGFQSAAENLLPWNRHAAGVALRHAFYPQPLCNYALYKGWLALMKTEPPALGYSDDDEDFNRRLSLALRAGHQVLPQDREEYRRCNLRWFWALF